MSTLIGHSHEWNSTHVSTPLFKRFEAEWRFHRDCRVERVGTDDRVECFRGLA